MRFSERKNSRKKRGEILGEEGFSEVRKKRGEDE
jgi:hypothetical protein